MEHGLSENIRALRLQNGMNQVQLAKTLGLSKQCISNWENDNVQPSVEMLEKLADHFGVTTDYLLGRSPDFVLDISGLTEEQSAHVRLLVKDLKALNRSR